MEKIEFESDVSNSTDDTIHVTKGNTFQTFINSNVARLYKFIFTILRLDELPSLEYVPLEDLRVLIVAKPFDPKIDENVKMVLDFLNQHDIKYYQPSGLDETQREAVYLSKINRVITLGGDGTILYATKMFYDLPMPPLISFSMGSMNYMCKFKDDEIAKTLKQ